MAVNESGWVGILLLVFCGVLSNITANLLGETMFHMDGLREYVISSSTSLTCPSYADIGEKAFGGVGKVATTVTQYATLCGITIIYLILFGTTAPLIYTNQASRQYNEQYASAVLRTCQILHLSRWPFRFVLSCGTTNNERSCLGGVCHYASIQVLMSLALLLYFLQSQQL